MKERVTRLALKVVALISSLTIVIAVEPYIKLKGNFEVEFGRPEVTQSVDVQSLHEVEATMSAPTVLEVE